MTRLEVRNDASGQLLVMIEPVADYYEALPGETLEIEGVAESLTRETGAIQLVVGNDLCLSLWVDGKVVVKKAGVQQDQVDPEVG